MLPPILEIYLVWHPSDTEGETILGWLLEHFHGTPYAGLIGGAVEVYARSARWAPGSDAPRPLPCDTPLPYDLPSARVTAIVPIIGTRLARAVEDDSSDWRRYLETMRAAADRPGNPVGVFPVRLHGIADGALGQLLGDLQELDRASAKDRGTLCRELSQAIAQLVNDPFGDRLTVFISHAKRHSPDEEPDYVDDLVARVRSMISDTHLRAYFDAADVQPGSDWDHELRSNAASNALLALRTDLYAGREWCQREFLIAKQAGMPIVTLNAVRRSEERGSFLMDHVPIVGYDHRDDVASERSIEEALNLLVDGALRRAVWGLQQEELSSRGVDWAPLHAPEPATIIPWLLANKERAMEDGRILVMHPDPPLGPDEGRVIDQLFQVAGVKAPIDVVTPRTYASRGGGEL